MWPKLEQDVSVTFLVLLCKQRHVAKWGTRCECDLFSIAVPTETVKKGNFINRSRSRQRAPPYPGQKIIDFGKFCNEKPCRWFWLFFLLCSLCFPYASLSSLCFPYVFIMFSLCFPWFILLPKVAASVRGAFLVLLWFPYCSPYVFLMSSLCLPYVFIMFSLFLPYVFLMSLGPPPRTTPQAPHPDFLVVCFWKKQTAFFCKNGFTIF